MPDSLISAIATVKGSFTGDILGDGPLLGPGERDSLPHLLTTLLGEVDPLAVPDPGGESALGESGFPEPLVRLRGAGLL